MMEKWLKRDGKGEEGDRGDDDGERGESDDDDWREGERVTKGWEGIAFCSVLGAELCKWEDFSEWKESEFLERLDSHFIERVGERLEEDNVVLDGELE